MKPYSFCKTRCHNFILAAICKVATSRRVNHFRGMMQIAHGRKGVPLRMIENTAVVHRFCSEVN